MEYETRIPTSVLHWYVNGELVKNPEFTNNMEVYRVGINANYNDIQDLQARTNLLEPIVEQDTLDIAEMKPQIQSLLIAVASIPNKTSDLINDSDFITHADLPTRTSDLTNDSGFIDKNVNDLVYYTLATATGSTIELSINSSTYVMTLKLKNSAGTVISSGSIDLPLESVVVGGSYDDTNKEIILTLQNGNTIEIPVADLVTGLQSEITSQNKLASDLIDDTNQTNKFVTTSEKSAWNAKYDKPANGIPNTDMTSEVQASLDKANASETELINSRTAYSGQAYASTGEAIRTQANEMHNAFINNLIKNDYYQEINGTIVASTGKYNASFARKTKVYKVSDFKKYVKILLKWQNCDPIVIGFCDTIPETDTAIAKSKNLHSLIGATGQSEIAVENYTYFLVSYAFSSTLPNDLGLYIQSNLETDTSLTNKYAKLVTGKNKFEKNANIINAYFANDEHFTIVDSNDYKITDFIDVSNFENKICVSPRLRKFLAYDSNYQPISASFINTAQQNAIITNNNYKYIRVNYYASDEDTLQIEDNTAPTVFAKTIHYYDELVEKLKNKYAISFGDSIMNGTGNSSVGILDILHSMFKNLTINDYSVGGASMAHQTERSYVSDQISQFINNTHSNPDIILLDGLSNDIALYTSGGEDMGTLTDSFDYVNNGYSTFVTGFEYCLGLLKDNFPSASIIYVLPHSSNGRNYTHEQTYGDMARAICKKWSIPVVDVYKEGNLTSRISNQLQLYTNYPSETSGTHPNQAGYEKSYIPLLIDVLKKIL